MSMSATEAAPSRREILINGCGMKHTTPEITNNGTCFNYRNIKRGFGEMKHLFQRADKKWDCENDCAMCKKGTLRKGIQVDVN